MKAFVIVNGHKCGPMDLNEALKDSQKVDNKEATYEFEGKKKVDGLPCIKIFLFLTFLWISDEGQRLFGLIILLPFLELLNYSSNYFYSEINEILYKKENLDLDETSPEGGEVNSINAPQKTNNENKKNRNLYIYYFLYYIITQDMFIISNQSAFALLKNAFGLESDNVQGIKFLKVLNFLKPVFGSVTRFRFSLMILAYYLDKGIYEKNDNNKNYSLDFLVRKILLGLRMDLDIIYLFFQMLININDKLFTELYIYFYINVSLFILDYLGFLFTKICWR